MTLPTSQDLYPVIDATWPAAEMRQLGPLTLRRGAGGGSRVSATTTSGPASPEHLRAAELAMDEIGQPRLFMIQDGQDGFDQLLQFKGYEVMDPVWIYAAQVDDIATHRPPPVTSFEVWPPLASQKEVWASGGIGPERLAVMDRAAHPKITLLGRQDDVPAATTYVGIHEDIAMLHALEVSQEFRRKGLARHLTRAAAFWAKDNGAKYFALLTTQANEGANKLYSSLGMTIVGQYHYRIQRVRK